MFKAIPTETLPIFGRNDLLKHLTVTNTCLSLHRSGLSAWARRDGKSALNRPLPGKTCDFPFHSYLITQGSDVEFKGWRGLRIVYPRPIYLSLYIYILYHKSTISLDVVPSKSVDVRCKTTPKSATPTWSLYSIVFHPTNRKTNKQTKTKQNK